MFTRFLQDESGSTAIEYGLIASLLALMAISGFRLVGTRIELMFTDTIAPALEQN